MSDQPKVSGNIEQMVSNLRYYAYDCGRLGNKGDGASVIRAQSALLSAIAELEQRAEKWKESAVAIHEAALCMKGIVLTKRVAAAFAALGDEWDEAVG